MTAGLAFYRARHSVILIAFIVKKSEVDLATDGVSAGSSIGSFSHAASFMH